MSSARPRGSCGRLNDADDGRPARAGVLRLWTRARDSRRGSVPLAGAAPENLTAVNIGSSRRNTLFHAHINLISEWQDRALKMRLTETTCVDPKTGSRYCASRLLLPNAVQAGSLSDLPIVIPPTVATGADVILDT